MNKDSMINELSVPQGLRKYIFKAYVVKKSAKVNTESRFIPTGFPCIIMHIDDSSCELMDCEDDVYRTMPKFYLCSIFTRPIVERSAYLYTLNIVLHPWVAGLLFPRRMLKANVVTNLGDSIPYSQMSRLLLGAFLANSPIAVGDLVCFLEGLAEAMRTMGTPTMECVEGVRNYILFIASHPYCKVADFRQAQNLLWGYKTLTRRFFECTGVTLGQFMKVKKELNAAKLLTKWDGELLESIANDCGYKSSGHFHSYCKRTFGRSPLSCVAHNMEGTITQELRLYGIEGIRRAW